jgi:hypothetical protein
MWVLILSKKFTGQTMSADERTQIMQWYEEQKGKLFSNKDELLAFWMDDVFGGRHAARFEICF